MTENNSKLKYFGYGLEVAGVIEGVKLIPVAKEFLFSGLGDTEIPAATAFYTESESQKVINGVGLSALPIANATLREAARTEMQLPDLEGAANTEDLGYNPAQIEDVYKRQALIPGWELWQQQLRQQAPRQPFLLSPRS